MKRFESGNVIVGIIIGVVLGLAAALAVAVYVTKVPVPFLNKGQSRTPEQDAAETRKNRDWDPNAPLYGKNPARPVPPAQGLSPDSTQAAPPVATIPAPSTLAPDKAPPAVTGRGARDPLGEFASAKAAANSSDPFIYFVQAGAFRTPEDAETQRAKLSLMGLDAKVTEREQSGRQVWRVRVGPFDKKDDADRQKEKLESSGVESALVRVQR
ncbi:MAG TPA: SPOR domain-containing protein [Ramlibacter sp.]|nr:SPOR domain-containing protein [Ramlibacter sp.]